MGELTGDSMFGVLVQLLQTTVLAWYCMKNCPFGGGVIPMAKVKPPVFKAPEPAKAPAPNWHGLNTHLGPNGKWVDDTVSTIGHGKQYARASARLKKSTTASASSTA